MKMSKVVAFVLAALMLASLVPLSYAQPALSGAEKYRAAKANYLKALEAYKSARQDYLKMMERARGGARGVTLDRAKSFLLSSIDAMIAHLQMVKARVDISRSLTEEQRAEIIETLDSYIAWLEDKRTEAEQASTKEELVEVAKDVRAKWLEVRVEVKKIAGKIIISKLDYVLSKAEEIGDRLEARVEALKAQGYDTQELEELLADYREHLSLAKEKRDAAKEKFEEISSVQEAHQLFRGANQLIRGANRHIREMFKDLRQIVKEVRKGEAQVWGRGFLYARGNGSAVIQGTGLIVVQGEGNLTVKVSNGTVRVYGEGEKIENTDGSTTYIGFGKAMIAGRDVYVSVQGTNLRIQARGNGTATLSGEGFYRIAKAEKSWSGEVSYGGAKNES